MAHLLRLLEYAQVEMFQLGEAVLEKVVLGGDQLASFVDALLEENGRGLVLQAGHLEGLHHDLVVAA